MRRILGTLSVVLSLASAAQADSKETIDLDNAAPAELLITEGDSRTVHYWSRQNEMWLELFRSNSDIEGFAEDPQSSLSQIKSGGRFWQWRDDAYVPLVSQEPILSGELTDEVFAKAVMFLGDFDEVPENTPANMELAIEVAGEPSIGALLGGTVFCSLGGTNCPIVIFKDGSPQSAVYVTISQSWGISLRSNANGFPYVETQQEKSLLMIDSQSGEEFEIQGITPRRSEPQPQSPKDLLE